MDKEDFERMQREEDENWEPLTVKQNLAVFSIWLAGVILLSLIIYGMVSW
jgi:hypothetical protein